MGLNTVANFAVIENQKVINVVLATPEFAANQPNWVECSDNVGIDWSYINGEFVDTRPKPTEQEVADAVRFERNQLLALSDWTQLRDTASESVKWETYRQELRDITNQSGFPWEINWPVKPS